MHDSKTRVDTKSASHKRKTLRIHSNHSRSSRLTSRTPAARVFGKHWGRTHWWQPVTAIVEDSRHTGRGRGFPRRRWTAGQTGTRAKRSPSGVLAAQKQTERNRGRRRRTPWPAPATGSASTEPWAVVLGSRATRTFPQFSVDVVLRRESLSRDFQPRRETETLN